MADGNYNPVAQVLDVLEELELETAQTLQAKDVKDLDDLDALLEESTALAGARKAAKQGRRLTEEQKEILEANELAILAAVWEEVEAVAHYVVEECECGESHRRFSAWYVYSRHLRHPDQRKLVKADDHKGLPSTAHTTYERVTYCTTCMDSYGLGQANADEIPQLSSLGEPFYCDWQDTLIAALEADLSSAPSNFPTDETKEEHF